MEFITHLPTTSIFVINMITFFLVTIGLAAFGNLLALVLPTRQDRTWEKLAQVIEVEPEVEPVSEFAFSEAALALFEEVQGLAEGRVSPPPHLPENLKGVPTLNVLQYGPLTSWYNTAPGIAKPVHTRWRPVRRRRPEHYQAC
jgi:hypothetical protein